MTHWCRLVNHTGGPHAQEFRVSACGPHVQGPSQSPTHVWAVFGAESAGTKLVARLVAHAANIAPFGAWGAEAVIVRERRQVHHFSLPWGSGCSEHHLPPTLERWPAPHARRVDESAAPLPPRFFLNVTQHVRHYAALPGAQLAVALLVVRDQHIARLSKSSLRAFERVDGSGKWAASHCPFPEAAAREDAVAYQLLAEALDSLPHASASTRLPGRAVRAIVSYETLMTLGVPYLRDVLESIGAGASWDGWAPTLVSENERYLKKLIDGRLARDANVPEATPLLGDDHRFPQPELAHELAPAPGAVARDDLMTMMGSADTPRRSRLSWFGRFFP